MMSLTARIVTFTGESQNKANVLSTSGTKLGDSEFTSSNNVFTRVIKTLRREGQDKTEHRTLISTPLNCLTRFIPTHLKDS